MPTTTSSAGSGLDGVPEGQAVWFVISHLEQREGVWNGMLKTARRPAKPPCGGTAYGCAARSGVLRGVHISNNIHLVEDGGRGVSIPDCEGLSMPTPRVLIDPALFVFPKKGAEELWRRSKQSQNSETFLWWC